MQSSSERGISNFQVTVDIDTVGNWHGGEQGFGKIYETVVFDKKMYAIIVFILVIK